MVNDHGLIGAGPKARARARARVATARGLGCGVTATTDQCGDASKGIRWAWL